MIKSRFEYSLEKPAVTAAIAPKKIVIASRESRLAMWQAEHIRDRLSGLYPGAEVSILGMTTRGDQILDRPLSQIGGKGLFIKELEVAMQEGRADLAVHSLMMCRWRCRRASLTAITARENRATPSSRTNMPASTTCRPVPSSALPACAVRRSCARSIHS